MAQQPLLGLRDRVVPMRVIVCGLHRTGTMSMRSALWELGFHDCYHMHTMMQNLDSHPQQWVRAFEAKYAGKGTFTKADWDHLLGHCQACCDLPAAIFSAELAETYPDAKVVILNRDPEKWHESVLHTIYKIFTAGTLWDRLERLYCFVFDPPTRNGVRFHRVMGNLVLNFDHGKEKDKAIGWFQAQYKEFRDRIPAERCLEYSIKDGWQPLCDHLGVPVPKVRDEKTGELVEAPFPHVNDREAFGINVWRISRASVSRANKNALALVGRLAVMGVVGYCGYMGWKTGLGGGVF